MDTKINHAYSGKDAPLILDLLTDLGLEDTRDHRSLVEHNLRYLKLQAELYALYCKHPNLNYLKEGAQGDCSMFPVTFEESPPKQLSCLLPDVRKRAYEFQAKYKLLLFPKESSAGFVDHQLRLAQTDGDSALRNYNLWCIEEDSSTTFCRNLKLLGGNLWYDGTHYMVAFFWLFRQHPNQLARFIQANSKYLDRLKFRNIHL